MQSDVKSPRHGQREVSGFRGLRTSALDTRSLPDGWLSHAMNVVFDAEGNARPKDGSEAWWPQLSQRVYLAEMEPAENSTWVNGTASAVTAAFGSQSRLASAAGATALTRTPAAAINLLLAGEYTAAQTSLTVYVRADTPADVASCTLELTSGAFASNTRSWDISVAVAAAVAGVWTPITVTVASGTDSGGALSLTAVNGLRITPTLTAGSNIYFDEVFAHFAEYTKSFCLGAIEYRRTSDSKRYTVAGFGETLYADLNEAKAPYKIYSQLTRNLPVRFDIAEDRLVAVNGVDDGLVFNGDVVRKLGFPKPTAWTPGFAYAGGGALTPADVYYYGVTFIYGTSAADKHGQSTMFESPTAATVSAGNSRIDLSGIPVGAVGAGVIARRIYRCRANAGPLASKYFVAEIADNTTTTYQDGAADSAILTGDVGPLNNGVPPTSRAAVWFQKGMVYLTKKAVYWSRPGVNLDESFEIVPAENFLLMGSAGELVGAVEFNGNLYVFARSGIAKLQWSGSVLVSTPVQRTSEQRAGNIGAMDDRAITVVQDRYIRFMDTFGQIWKMLPNEEILPESSVVRNILDDCNNLPLSSSLDYNSVDSLAQWQTAGGLDAGTNLSVTDEEGALVYGKASLPKTTMNAGTLQLAYSTRANSGATTRGQYGISRVFRANNDEFTFAVSGTAGQALRIDQLTLRVYAEGAWGGDQDVSFQMYPFATAYEAGGVRGQAMGASNTVTIRPTASDVVSRPNGFELTFTLGSPVHLPAQEVMYFTVKTFGGYAAQPVTSLPVYIGVLTSTQPAELRFGDRANGTLYWSYYESWYPTTYAGWTPWITWSGRVYDKESWSLVRPAHDAGLTLQRFHQFAADSLALRSYGSVQVYAQYSTDGTAWGPGTGDYAGQLIYERKFLAASSSTGEPLYTEFYGFPLPGDYRSGEPFPSGSRYRYIRLNIRMGDTNLSVRPATEALSRVSTDYAVAFPQVVEPELTTATEAAFSAPYAKEDYLRDIWTSIPIGTAGIARFGKLYADYTENQQSVFFQVRTATSSAGLSAATWYDVTPNTEIGTTGVVASATHFQYRIIFQDNPVKQTGTPSAVHEVRWSWAIAGSEASPITPPVVYHYKDYTFISWASAFSRVNDRSLAVDDYTLAYENEDGHRWSQFQAPHYACYCLVGNKLVGGTASGGRLVRLRNSAVTEYDGRKVVASLRTLPLNLGSMFLKTLHWVYFGLVLNMHRAGEYLADLNRWPAMQVGWSFDWFVDGGLAPLASPGGPPSPAYLQAQGFVHGTQGYPDLLSHAHTAQSLALYPNTKPYQAEYGFDLGLQERAFSFQATWSPKVDTAINIPIFPTLTNIGMEFYIENYRGV